MPMIFSLTMLSDENDGFVREYEIDYDTKLTDLHKFICSDMKFDPMHMASFFTSNREWEKLHEYTLLDMGAGLSGDETPSLPMEGVVLGMLLRRNHDRLIYMFDFLNDRAFYIELMTTSREEAGVAYPRCIKSEGTAPDQFETGGEVDAGGSIFDEVMEDFNDFEGDELYDDDM